MYIICIYVQYIYNYMYDMYLYVFNVVIYRYIICINIILYINKLKKCILKKCVCVYIYIYLFIDIGIDLDIDIDMAWTCSSIMEGGDPCSTGWLAVQGHSKQH